MQQNWCKKWRVWGIMELVEMKSFIDFSWKERWPYSVWSCNHGSRSSHWEKNDAAFTVGGGNGHSELNVFKPMIGCLRDFHLISLDFEDGLCYCISYRKEVCGKRTLGNWTTSALRSWETPVLEESWIPDDNSDLITGVRNTTGHPRYVGTNCYLDKGPLHY